AGGRSHPGGSTESPHGRVEELLSGNGLDGGGGAERRVSMSGRISGRTGERLHFQFVSPSFFRHPTATALPGRQSENQHVYRPRTSPRKLAAARHLPAAVDRLQRGHPSRRRGECPGRIQWEGTLPTVAGSLPVD